MRYLAALCLALALAGCGDRDSWPLTGPATGASPTKTTVVEVFTDACNAYAAALQTAAVALQANALTEAQIASVDQAKVVGDGVCKGPVPTDYVAAAVNVLELTAEITQTAGAQ